MVVESAPNSDLEATSANATGRRCHFPEADGRLWIGRAPVRLPISDCRLGGGVIVDGLALNTHSGVAARQSSPSTPPTTTVQSGEIPDYYLELLERTGIQDRPYRGLGEDPNEDGGDYDGADSTGDLTSYLDSLDPALGTYTVKVCYDNDAWEPGAPYDYAEAVTDIHIGEQIFWVNAQSMNSLNMDADEDGGVTFYTSWDPTAPPTEGNCALIVYDSRASADADFGASGTTP